MVDERLQCVAECVVCVAYNAVLTDAGLNRYKEVTPTHNISLRRYLFDHLEGIDLDALGDALQRITAAADHRTTVPSPTA